MEILRSVTYRGQHITGPSAVLVSIRFGTAPAGGPAVVRILGEGKQEAVPQFDLERHVAEILDGVAAANREMGGNLEVQVIEVVPDDYPSTGQARYVAWKIALAVLRGEV